MTESAASYIELPAKVRSPRLAGGRIHKLRVDRDFVTIATWKGIFGNQHSDKLLQIPIHRIQSANFMRWKLTTRQCVIRYVDELGRVNLLRFVVVDNQANGLQDGSTETITLTINGLINQENMLPNTPIRIELKPPGLKNKFFYGLFFLGGSLLLSILQVDLIVLKILAIFVLLPSLIALTIDYLRNNTNWHPAIKIGLSVLVFVVLFVLFVFLVGFV